MLMFQRDIEGITAQGLIMDAVQYFEQAEGRCLVTTANGSAGSANPGCGYRSGDGSRACVVGSYLTKGDLVHLSNEELLDAQAETVVYHLSYRDWLGREDPRWSSASKHSYLLGALQEVHDASNHWTEDGTFNDKGWHTLAKVAEEYGVSPLALERGGE